jgi:hypothetical protein
VVFCAPCEGEVVTEMPGALTKPPKSNVSCVYCVFCVSCVFCVYVSSLRRLLIALVRALLAPK